MGKQKSSENQKRNQTRQAFLHTFFDDSSIYGVREINGFVLLKHPNGNTGGTEIAIFTKENYETYLTFKNELRPA